MAKKNKIDTEKDYVVMNMLENKSFDSEKSKHGFKSKRNSGKNLVNKNKY